MGPGQKNSIWNVGHWLSRQLKLILSRFFSANSSLTSNPPQGDDLNPPPVQAELVLSSDQRSLVLHPDKYFEHNARAGNPLAIRLSIHTLDALVHELIPFYSGNCPISVVFGNSSGHGEHPADVVQATLTTIQDDPNYTPNTRSAFLLIGRRR